MIAAHLKAFKRAGRELNYEPKPAVADVVDFVHDQVAFEELDYQAENYDQLAFMLEAKLTGELLGLLGWFPGESDARKLTTEDMAMLRRLKPPA